MTSSYNSITPYTSLVEDHASQLIDQLFQDIEQELEGTSPKPSTNGKVSTASSLLNLRQSTATQEIENIGLLVPYIEMDATLESFYDPQPAQRSSSPVQEDPRQSFTQGVLLGITCLSFVGSVGLWMAAQFINHSSTPPVTAQTLPSVTPSVNPADVAFVNEMEQSFQVAERAPSPVPMVTSALVASTALPSITSNLPPATAVPQAATSVVPPTQTQQVQSSAPKLKSSQVASPALKMHTLQPPVLPSLQPIALNTVGQSPLSSKLVAPKAALSSPTVSSFMPQTLPVSRQGKVGVVVQGILDLGDKSAMLIARNGSTQNIKLGEVLDATGWVFLRVEHGQAIIQRGNEVRTVSGGEEF